MEAKAQHHLMSLLAVYREYSDQVILPKDANHITVKVCMYIVRTTPKLCSRPKLGVQKGNPVHELNQKRKTCS